MKMQEVTLSQKIELVKVFFPDIADEHIEEVKRLDTGFARKSEYEKLMNAIEIHRTFSGLGFIPLLSAYKCGLVFPLFGIEEENDTFLLSIYESLAEFTVQEQPLSVDTVYLLPFFETVEGVGFKVHVKWFTDKLESGGIYLFSKDGVERVEV